MLDYRSCGGLQLPGGAHKCLEAPYTRGSARRVGWAIVRSRTDVRARGTRNGVRFVAARLWGSRFVAIGHVSGIVILALSCQKGRFSDIYGSGGPVLAPIRWDYCQDYFQDYCRGVLFWSTGSSGVSEVGMEALKPTDRNRNWGDEHKNGGDEHKD